MAYVIPLHTKLTSFFLSEGQSKNSYFSLLHNVKTGTRTHTLLIRNTRVWVLCTWPQLQQNWRLTSSLQLCSFDLHNHSFLVGLEKVCCNCIMTPSRASHILDGKTNSMWTYSADTKYPEAKCGLSQIDFCIAVHATELRAQNQSQWFIVSHLQIQIAFQFSCVKIPWKDI